MLSWPRRVGKWLGLLTSAEAGLRVSYPIRDDVGRLVAIVEVEMTSNLRRHIAKNDERCTSVSSSLRDSCQFSHQSKNHD